MLLCCNFFFEKTGRNFGDETESRIFIKPDYIYGNRDGRNRLKGRVLRRYLKS